MRTWLWFYKGCRSERISLSSYTRGCIVLCDGKGRTKYSGASPEPVVSEHEQNVAGDAKNMEGV